MTSLGRIPCQTRLPLTARRGITSITSQMRGCGVKLAPSPLQASR